MKECETEYILEKKPDFYSCVYIYFLYISIYIYIAVLTVTSQKRFNGLNNHL